MFVAFKQSRVEGQINPLRPPLHAETVLIGRALDQPTGYLRGVGYRVRDDGYVEAEFVDGVRKFDSYKHLKVEVNRRLKTGHFHPPPTDAHEPSGVKPSPLILYCCVVLL